MRTPRALAILAALLLPGCGQGPTIVPVSGKITVDGEPGRKLFVQFEPVSNDPKNINPGQGSIGRTDDQGVFTMLMVPDKRPGAVLGKHEVRVVAEGDAEDDDTRALKGLPLTKRAKPRQLPKKYNEQTELSFEVKPGGTTEANFALSWK